MDLQVTMSKAQWKILDIILTEKCGELTHRLLQDSGDTHSHQNKEWLRDELRSIDGIVQAACY